MLLNAKEKYAKIKALKSYRGYMLSIKKIIATMMLILFASANTVPAFAYDYKIEHIKPVKRNAFNQVNIMSDEAVILQHNLLKIAFNSNFNSKTAVVGERVDFSLLPLRFHRTFFIALLSYHICLIDCFACKQL